MKPKSNRPASVLSSIATAMLVASTLHGASATAATFQFRQPAHGVSAAKAPVEVVPPAGPVAIKNFGSYRGWADGSVASSCAAYRNPESGFAYSGDVGDGIYQLSVNGTTTPVYCDMTTDGGGWALAMHATTVTSAHDYFLKDIMVRGYPLKTVSQDTAAYPPLPNGLTNNYAQVLHKGGTSGWQAKMGSWVRLSTVSGFPTSTTLSGVLTASGRTSAYLSGIGWYIATATASDWFMLWDAAGVSPICGGTTSAGPKNCPAYAQVAWTDLRLQPHFDTSSARQLFVR